MDIYDKIQEIKQLTIGTDGMSAEDEKNLLKIIGICENILIDHPTRQALEKLNERLQP